MSNGRSRQASEISLAKPCGGGELVEWLGLPGSAGGWASDHPDTDRRGGGGSTYQSEACLVHRRLFIFLSEIAGTESDQNCQVCWSYSARNYARMS